MKSLLRPQIVIVGTAALALLGWSTVSAATGSPGSRQHATVAVQTERSEVSPTAEPQPQNQAPEPAEAPEQQNQAPEDENENENENENNNPAPQTAAPTVTSRTFQLVGGTVSFTCTGNALSLDSAVPASGFSVETESEDGGQELKVRFENDAHRSEIRAACVGGQVQATEIREESD